MALIFHISTSESHFLSLFYVVLFYPINCFYCILFHIQNPACNFPTVFCKQFDQIRGSGDSRDRVHVGVESEGKGKDGVDGGLLFHVLRSCGSNRKVGNRDSPHGSGDSSEEVCKPACVGACPITEHWRDSQGFTYGFQAIACKLPGFGGTEACHLHGSVSTTH